MSTSARVNSNSCTLAFLSVFFWRGSETKGRNHEAKIARGCRLSIALHPRGTKGRNQITDDSGQALDLPPNPAPLAFAAVSADNLLKLPPAFIDRKEPLSLGRPKRIGTARPATLGLRTSTKKNPV